MAARRQRKRRRTLTVHTQSGAGQAVIALLGWFAAAMAVMALLVATNTRKQRQAELDETARALQSESGGMQAYAERATGKLRTEQRVLVEQIAKQMQLIQEQKMKIRGLEDEQQDKDRKFEAILAAEREQRGQFFERASNK